MLQPDASTLVFMLLMFGATATVLTLYVLQAIYRAEPSLEVATEILPDETESQQTEGILIVQTGGRVAYLNQRARELLNVWEETPSLERLARKIRPRDAFFNLCGSAAEAELYLENKPVRAVSNPIPYGQTGAFIITFEPVQTFLELRLGDKEKGEGNISSQTVTLLNDLGRAMTASLDPEETIKATLESIERVIACDSSEITLLNQESQLLTVYHLTGYPGEARQLEKHGEIIISDRPYTQQLILQQKPLIENDVRAKPIENHGMKNRPYAIRSLVGAPLATGGELIGTLELGSFSKDAYTTRDIEILQILSGQAAAALKNALLYKEEQQRVKELIGLAQLTRGVSTTSVSNNLFSHLLESILPLMDVEFLGFLIYDESRRTLQGQLPFVGLHADVIEWTHTLIEADSLADEVFQSREMIVASQSMSDPRIQAFGLDKLAIAAGMRQTVLAPLTSSGRMLGYLLVSDKRDGTPFDPDDLRLISIIAGQAGPMVENADLIQQSERRAQRAETLRRIASLSGSSATLDEILKYSVQDLARLLKADKAGVLLLDETRGELRLHKASLFGISPEFSIRTGYISTNDPEFNHAVSRTHYTIISDDINADLQLPKIYHPILFSLGLRSVMIVPLRVRDRGIGEMIIGSYQTNYFVSGDIQTVITAAGQLANVVERSTLYTQTDETLRRRVDQLTALTRISRDLNTNLDLRNLLQRVYDEILQTTRADCGRIILFDTNPTSPQPSSGGNGNKPEPRILLHLGDSLPTELSPLELGVLENAETCIMDDSEGSEPSIPDSPYQPPHEGVKASLIVPITYQDKPVGLIHMHADTPGRFDEAAKEISEALALQASVALGNVYRYQEQLRSSELLNRRVGTLAKLIEDSPTSLSEESLNFTLVQIARAIQETTHYQYVSISTIDADEGWMKLKASTELPDGSRADDLLTDLNWEQVEKLLQPENKLGIAYFIPKEESPARQRAIQSASSHNESPEPVSGHAWVDGDMLLIPLFGSGNHPLGVISLDKPLDHLRPDTRQMEGVEVFAKQATHRIEAFYQMQCLQSRLNEMQDELQRAQLGMQSAHSHLPVLLHKDLEQTIAVQRLSQRAARIRAAMNIAEMVNRQGDRESVLSTFAREILTKMEMDIALVVEPGAHGPHLLTSQGLIPAGIQLEALIGQRNPIHHTLQNGNTLLVSRIEADSEWVSSPLLQALDAKGFICLPVFIGARLDAVLLAINQTPMAPFTRDDEQLFNLLARLVAITLQNLNLLLEISQHLAEVNLLLDFNRQIGNLQPERILQTLVESTLHVLPIAQTSLVVLWDPKRELLIPRAAAGYSEPNEIMGIFYQPGEGLPGKAYQLRSPIRVDEVDFPSLYNLSSEKLLAYHDATGGLLPVSCMAIPLQKAPNSEPLGVLIVENFKAPQAFSIEAQALVTSLTQQTALNLENSRLYQAVELRANQLQSLTGVAATISSNLEPVELIDTLLDHCEAIVPFKTGTLWLRQGEEMFVRAARGFADNDQRVGLSVSIEDSALIREMISTGHAIAIADASKDPRFPALLEKPNLSWLGVPLIAGGEVIGVIALEMDTADFYTTEHIQIATTFAGQAAVALENANLYQQIVSRATELDQRSRRLETLYRFSTALSSSLDLDHLLTLILQGMLETIHSTTVSMILFDSTGRATLYAEQPPHTDQLPVVLPDSPLFERLKQSLGSFSCEDTSGEAELKPIADYLEKLKTHSLLALSLATGNELHGVILVHSDQPYHYTADEIGLARTISNQAAIAIQNARLYRETQSLTNELDQRVKERTEQLARAHQRTKTLLSLMTELATSLDLEQVLSRTLKSLNRLVDAEHITVLLARTGEAKLHHLASVGYQTPLTTEEFYTSLDPDQGLAGWIIKQRKPVLVPDLKEDPRWLELPNNTLQYRSAIGVPLMIGGASLGALLFFHRSIDHFSPDQLDLIQAAANQVAIAVNNAELYSLIRDQAEDLGKMVRNQQIETQRSKAILEDVADGVLVTDENMQITLFNSSAEKILGLERSRVIGKSLEHFTGLFGKAARTWMETIRKWSQEPDSYQQGDVYAEQIRLEDGHVVSVHLAPVSLRETFLGTVSIFRDITHQVEVDRLKSEFVSTVSHELRTPMTSIKGYVDILLMGAAGPLNEQQKRFLDIVKNNAERLAILVNDLLDISRIESGRLKLSLQPIDLSQLARQAIADLVQRSQEENRPMQIESQIPRKLPRIWGDPDQVRRILDNLLENAYLYTPENGYILLRIHQKDDHLQVDIKDNGIGIPPEMQPRVFERFFRGENPSVLATSGTGLGLSIVQNLVEMQDGKIWLESSGVEGEGSTFSFTLPIYHLENG